MNNSEGGREGEGTDAVGGDEAARGDRGQGLGMGDHPGAVAAPVIQRHALEVQAAGRRMVVRPEQRQGLDALAGLDDQLVVLFDAGTEGGQQGVLLAEPRGDQFGIATIDIDEVETVVFHTPGLFALLPGNDQFDGNVHRHVVSHVQQLFDIQ